MGNCHCREVGQENNRASISHQRRTTSQSFSNKKQLDNYSSEVDDILGNERTFYSFDKSKKSVCDFQIVKKIGQGNFGTVYHVYCPVDKKNYAMKVILKSRVKDDRQRQHALNEKNILASNTHPFLLKLYYSFQDESKLYLITEYVEGGDLYMNMKYKQRFNDREVLFYASEIIVALEHLHSKGIIYRDLKPENILLTKQGHIKLADFGLSKIKNFKEERTTSQCGTPDYIAPEIVMGQGGHNESVDLWSLGTVIYELYHGYPPFYCKDKKKQILDSINKEVLISKKINPEAQDLIQKLLQPNPENRLGKDGLDDLKQHSFFKNVDWDKVSKREIETVKPIRNETIKKEMDNLNAKKGYPSSEIDLNQDNSYRLSTVLDYSFNHNQNIVQIPHQVTKSQLSSKIIDTNTECTENDHQTDQFYVKQQYKQSQDLCVVSDNLNKEE